MPATLTDAMKSDLHLGNAELKIALWSDTALTATTFTDADSIFTVKDTLAITEGTPTFTSLKLDQLNETYAAPLTDKGDSTIAATIPFNAMELFDYFYTAAGTQPTATEAAPLVIDGESYKEAKAFKFSDKVVKARVYIRSQSGNTAIVLMNVNLAVSIAYSNVSSSPLGLALSGSIMEDGARGSIVVLKG